MPSRLSPSSSPGRRAPPAAVPRSPSSTYRSLACASSVIMSQIVTAHNKRGLMHSPEAHSQDAGEPTALEELQQRNAELRAAVAARDTFIAVAAHELRNPMTPMIGQIDLLLRGLRAGRYTPQQIEQRLERVRLVMNQYLKRAATLLDVSRITTGKLILAPTSFDLVDLVRETVETFAAAARHAGTWIHCNAPAPLLGTWGRLAMEQIIDNLVSNAIKYGAQRPVEICAEDHGDNVAFGCEITAQASPWKRGAAFLAALS